MRPVQYLLIQLKQSILETHLHTWLKIDKSQINPKQHGKIKVYSKVYLEIVKTEVMKDKLGPTVQAEQ